jgi:hypothetical protein
MLIYFILQLKKFFEKHVTISNALIGIFGLLIIVFLLCGVYYHHSKIDVAVEEMERKSK